MPADEIILQKTCTKCGISQPVTNFHKAKKGKYGVTAECKSCVRIYTTSPARRARHYERNIAWKQAHAEQVKQRTKEYYKENREKILARALKWQRENKEHRKAYLHQYYEQRRAEIIAATYAWQRANRKKVLIYVHNRRGRRAGADGSFTLELWISKCQFYGFCCYLCHKPLKGRDLTIDHRIPLSRGGSNWVANLAPACNACNAGKCDMTDQEYRSYRQGNLTRVTLRA